MAADTRRARAVAELHDAGLVQLLGLESDPPALLNASDIILPGEIHLPLVNSIDNTISTRPHIPRDGLPDPERASRIVERRVTLWNVGLAMHLGADLGHFASGGVSTEQAIQREGTYLGLRLDVSDLLFAVSGVASVSSLSVDELVTLRKQLPKVRKQITRLAEDHARLSSDPAEREESLDAIADSIRELQAQVLDSVARRRGIQGGVRLAAGLMLDVVGLFFYQFSIVGMFGDVAEFLWDARKDRLVLYMHSISRAPGIEASPPPRLLGSGPAPRLRSPLEDDNIVE
jgi:hypothetical protein